MTPPDALGVALRLRVDDQEVHHGTWERLREQKVVGLPYGIVQSWTAASDSQPDHSLTDDSAGVVPTAALVGVNIDFVG